MYADISAQIGLVEEKTSIVPKYFANAQLRDCSSFQADKSITFLSR